MDSALLQNQLYTVYPTCDYFKTNVLQVLIEDGSILKRPLCTASTL